MASSDIDIDRLLTQARLFQEQGEQSAARMLYRDALYRMAPDDARRAQVLAAMNQGGAAADPPPAPTASPLSAPEPAESPLVPDAVVPPDMPETLAPGSIPTMARARAAQPPWKRIRWAALALAALVEIIMFVMVQSRFEGSVLSSQTPVFPTSAILLDVAPENKSMNDVLLQRAPTVPPTPLPTDTPRPQTPAPAQPVQTVYPPGWEPTLGPTWAPFTTLIPTPTRTMTPGPRNPTGIFNSGSALDSSGGAGSAPAPAPATPVPPPAVKPPTSAPPPPPPPPTSAPLPPPTSAPLPPPTLAPPPTAAPPPPTAAPPPTSAPKPTEAPKPTKEPKPTNQAEALPTVSLLPTLTALGGGG